MMNRRASVRRCLLEAAALSILTLSVLAPWGCSKTPVAPAPASVAYAIELPNGVIAIPGTLLGDIEPAEPGTFELAPVPFTLDSASVAGVGFEEYGPFVEDISSNGGTIILTIDADTSYFMVPDAGLEKTTEITVTVKRDLNAADARITEFEFAPKGLQFEKCAELAYRTDSKDGESLLLYWWQERTQTWVKSAEAIVVNGFATFPVEHFSKYRTKERISLGGQRGNR